MDVRTLPDAQLAEYQRQIQYATAVQKARDSLIAFTQFMMPDPEFENDYTKSLYEIRPHHILIAEAFERVERGECLRLALSIPPQHGKSELLSRKALAWYMGKHPQKAVMFGTYNQDRANEEGGEVRTIMASERYAAVFPRTKFRPGSKAKDHMVTTRGGQLAFIGRGGSGTGKPSDLTVIDDPLKNSEEADSVTIRKQLHSWFTKVIYSRAKTLTAIIIIHCMTGDTPVLMESGAEKPLRDIRPGDRVATYENGKLAASTVRNWANQGPDRVFTIKMKSGKSVRANARHPFLVYEDGEEKWLRTDLLKQGSVILSAIGGNGRGKNAPPMGVMNPPSAGASACRTTINRGGKVALARLRLILDRGVKHTFATAMALTSLLTSACSPSRAGFVQSVNSHPRPKIPAPTGKEYSASITATIAGGSEGSFATTAISPSGTGKLKPPFSQSLDTFEIGHDVIAEIVESGVEDVFDIQVDRTENFIANGLVSHNTRWHEDDLIGRLCDPDHPEHDPILAENWTYINVPAVLKPGKIAEALGAKLEIQTAPAVKQAFGTVPMASLWPSRFSLEHLASAAKLDPVGFNALYMGKPTPDDGEYFKAEWIDSCAYDRDALPKNLRKYGASDHAVTEKTENDSNVIGCIGVDDQDDIWVLPDLVWERMETDRIVEELIAKMKEHRPLMWWMEDEMISKSFGPFLFKRMRETKTNCMIDPVKPSRDKRTRARSIQGRMAMKRVHLPRFAPWFREARSQMLKFPFATHDDFVDWMSHVGQGLNKEIRADPSERSNKIIKVGSMAWVKAAANRERKDEDLRKKLAGW